MLSHKTVKKSGRHHAKPQFSKPTAKQRKKCHVPTTSPNHTTPTTSPHRQSKRTHYQVPYYHGFEEAFQRQIKSYTALKHTPISLSSFLHWPVNHIEISPYTPKLEKYLAPDLGAIQAGQPTQTLYTKEYEKRLIENANFLWQELPIRFSHSVEHLSNLPYNLSATPQVLLIKHWYELSFRDIITTVPPTTIDEENNFVRVLNNILQRHNNVIPLLSQALLVHKPIIFNNQIRNTSGLPSAEHEGQICNYLQQFLDKFYMNRIAMRMLIGQHIACHQQVLHSKKFQNQILNHFAHQHQQDKDHQKEHAYTPLQQDQHILNVLNKNHNINYSYCGLINLELDPLETTYNVVEDAKTLINRTYNVISPDVHIMTSSSKQNSILDKTYPSQDWYRRQVSGVDDDATAHHNGPLSLFPSLHGNNGKEEPLLPLDEHFYKVYHKLCKINNYDEYHPEEDRISYIDSHLSYMLLELLKNSLRATIEFHADNALDYQDMPPLLMQIAHGNKNEFTMKLSDYGGGIKKKNEGKLFTYLFTTADAHAQEELKSFNLDDGEQYNEFQMDYNLTYHRNEEGHPNHKNKQEHKAHQQDGNVFAKTFRPTPTVGGAPQSGSVRINPMTPFQSLNTNSLYTPDHNMALAGSDDATISSPPEPHGSPAVTAQQQPKKTAEVGGGAIIPAGFGVGLPLSRLFSRFADGDLTLQTIEGLGTDVVLHVKTSTGVDSQGHAHHGQPQGATHQATAKY